MTADCKITANWDKWRENDVGLNVAVCMRISAAWASVPLQMLTKDIHRQMFRRDAFSWTGEGIRSTGEYPGGICPGSKYPGSPNVRVSESECSSCG